MTFREAIQPIVKKHAGFLYSTIMRYLENKYDLNKEYNRGEVEALLKGTMYEKYIKELPE